MIGDFQRVFFFSASGILPISRFSKLQGTSAGAIFVSCGRAKDENDKNWMVRLGYGGFQIEKE